MINLRHWVGRVVSGLSLLLGAACSGGGVPLPPTTTALPPVLAPTEGPSTSGPLRVLCTVADDWCQLMTAAFAARTGIATTFVRLSSGEALENLRTHAAAPEFDVWHGGPADAYFAAKAEGLLQPYASPAAAAIPTQLKDPENYWTGAYVGALGFCVNEARLAALGVPLPQTWDDLLNPALQGHLAIAHPATSGTAYTALWTQVTLHQGDQAAALAYFQQLHPNVISYTRAGRLPAQLASQGAIAVGVTFSHDCVKAGEEGPEPVVAVFPTEGTGYEIGGLAIVSGPVNVRVAKTYVDWALSKEAQELPATARWYQLPTNPEAAIPRQSASQVKLVAYDFVAAGAARDALIQQFSQAIAPPPP